MIENQAKEYIQKNKDYLIGIIMVIILVLIPVLAYQYAEQERYEIEDEVFTDLENYIEINTTSLGRQQICGEKYCYDCDRLVYYSNRDNPEFREQYNPYDDPTDEPFFRDRALTLYNEVCK